MSKSPRFRNLLRTVLSGILSSNLSTIELRSLAQELRKGRFPDELAYMIDEITKHFISEGDDATETEILSTAERLVKQQRISHVALVNIVQSLGGDYYSSSLTAKQILANFIAESSPSRARKLIEALKSSGDEDKFLSGISKTRG